MCVITKIVPDRAGWAHAISGFAKGMVHSYRTGDEIFTVANSLRGGLFVQVKLGIGAEFIPDKPVDNSARVRTRRGLVLCAVYDNASLGRGDKVSGEVLNIIPGNTLQTIKISTGQKCTRLYLLPALLEQAPVRCTSFEGGDIECKHGRGLVCLKCGAKRVKKQAGRSRYTIATVGFTMTVENVLYAITPVATEVHRVLQ